MQHGSGMNLHWVSRGDPHRGVDPKVFLLSLTLWDKVFLTFSGNNSGRTVWPWQRYTLYLFFLANEPAVLAPVHPSVENSPIKVPTLLRLKLPLHNMCTLLGFPSFFEQLCADELCEPVWVQLLPLTIHHPGNCSKYLSFQTLPYKIGQVAWPSKLW